jgi:hypothetical protein
MDDRRTMDQRNDPPIGEIASHLATMPGVRAVALGGSAVSGHADPASDCDLYVYVDEPPPIALRTALAVRYDPAPEIDNRAFGPGDEWTVGGGQAHIDLIYWSAAWIEDQLDRVLVRHEPPVGYSTCLWRTVQHSVPLVDPSDWFGSLQASSRRPYPEPLRRAIVALNWPLLRTAHSSFLKQIERAIEREDAISVQHRTAALLASWFDILFALNRRPHPGEKRLLAFARAECELLPPAFESQTLALIAKSATANDVSVIECAHALIDGLEALLRENGLLERLSRPAGGTSPSTAG